jgi:hypothetical protein
MDFEMFMTLMRQQSAGILPAGQLGSIGCSGQGAFVILARE